jgi:hypothetical protein
MQPVQRGEAPKHDSPVELPKAALNDILNATISCGAGEKEADDEGDG